jgi:hypothetical protein
LLHLYSGLNAQRQSNENPGQDAMLHYIAITPSEIKPSRARQKTKAPASFRFRPGPFCAARFK